MTTRFFVSSDLNSKRASANARQLMSSIEQSHFKSSSKIRPRISSKVRAASLPLFAHLLELSFDELLKREIIDAFSAKFLSSFVSSFAKKVSVWS